MKKRGWFLIAVLVAAAVLMIVIPRMRQQDLEAKRSMTVYVNGAEYIKTPLIDGKTVEIRQENGCVNIIRMTQEGFFMESSTCKNHECIDQGEVNESNWKSRKLLNQIICLPNRVVVELDTAAESTDVLVPDV